MTPDQKNDIVVRFLQGESVTEISAAFACRRSSIEDLLRQAMFSLMKMREVGHPSTTVADVVAADAH